MDNNLLSLLKSKNLSRKKGGTPNLKNALTAAEKEITLEIHNPPKMSDTKTLSVLLPTYNRAELLGMALEGLALQTFKDFQVIIWDDGSTDKTKKVVDGFSKRLDIDYHKSEVNEGVGAVRNKLLALVKTPYFAWQDSDDISQPDRFEKQLDKIGEADMCFTYAFYFKHPNKNNRYIRSIDVSKYTSREGFYQNMLFATGLCSAKCAKIKFDKNLKRREDITWLAKLVRGGCTFACVEEPLYYIRQHVGRLTNSNENNTVRQ